MEESVVVAPLITDPFGIFIFLVSVTGIVFYLSELPALKRFFHFVSPILFCYFLPMLATTFGVLPSESPLYSLVNNAFLPAVLILVLLSCDMKAIMRLGWRALGVMGFATLGIMLGAVMAFVVLGGAERFGEFGAASFGALSASWVGGSANMMAVAGALQVPDLAPLLLVDSVLVYSWMGMLVVLAVWQRRADRALRVPEQLMRDMHERVAEYSSRKALPLTTAALLAMLALGFGGGQLCAWVAGLVHKSCVLPLAATWPEAKTFSAFTITIILVTSAGVWLSMTPLRKLEDRGASQVGYALLYLLLPTFGAQANLMKISGVHYYFAAGVIILLTHGLFVIVALRLFRMPLFIGATASQANLGGAASGSVVAGTYQPAMMPVGILFGVVGGVMGTYTGLIVAYICRML